MTDTTEWADRYFAWMDELDRRMAPLLDELTAAGVKAYLLNTGGGCMVLDVPISENGERTCWLGWCSPETGYDLLIDCDQPPTDGWHITGCGYLGPEMERYFTFDDRVVGVDGTAVECIRAMATEAMTAPEERFEWV